MHVLIIYRLGGLFIFKMAACLLVIQHGPSGKLPSLWLCRCPFLLYHQPENHEFLLIIRPNRTFRPRQWIEKSTRHVFR